MQATRPAHLHFINLSC